MKGTSVDPLAVAELRSHGLTWEEIGQKLGCTDAWAAKLYRRMKRSENADGDEGNRDLHEVCADALGRRWVESRTGGDKEASDLRVLQLYAALRVVQLDSESLVSDVRRRLAEIRKAQLDDVATSHIGEMRGPT